MSDEEIFWCGSVLNHKGLQKYKGETPAATQWSRGLLKGILENDVNVTGFAPIWDALFPKGELFPTDKDFLDPSIKQVPVQYLNFPFLRTASVAYSLERKIVQLISKGKKPLAILNYNTYPYYCKALKAVIKRFPDIAWINVVLDLDDPTIDNWAKFLEDTEGAKGNIFLSWWGYENAPCEKKLHLDGGWEGGLPVSKESEEKTFIYAGKLSDYGGVTEIISAINGFPDENVYFDFYGKGEHDGLHHLASKDKRVRIRGFVKDEVLDEACLKATAFLSPRDVNFQGTRMVFPSKLIFYLKYNKPVIAPGLPGVSPEYKDVLIQPGSSSTEDWIKSMKIVLSMTQDEKDGLKTRIQELLKQKSWSFQAARLINFVRDI